MKLEKGVIYKVYTNIPYERIQNIDIYRGIIARLCGFSAVSVQTAGSYLIDFRYSNGTGPWKTDNNCSLLSLYVNGDYQGVQVFPQRGQDEWSDWGWSNSTKINLYEGSNNIKLVLEDWNTNMDGEINTAMLDNVRIISFDLN